jgi:hypothetical protein
LTLFSSYLIDNKIQFHGVRKNGFCMHDDFKTVPVPGRQTAQRLTLIILFFAAKLIKNFKITACQAVHALHHDAAGTLPPA